MEAVALYTCARCKLVGDGDVINHEGWLHHNSPLVCIDHKRCTRRVRKLRRKHDKSIVNSVHLVVS